MTTFSERINNKKHPISLVVAPVENGVMAWYFIDVPATKWNKFKKDIFAGGVNLELYGNVVKRGYGSYPPQDIIQEMKDHHGYVPRNDASST